MTCPKNARVFCTDILANVADNTATTCVLSPPVEFYQVYAYIAYFITLYELNCTYSYLFVRIPTDELYLHKYVMCGLRQLLICLRAYVVEHYRL